MTQTKVDLPVRLLGTASVLPGKRWTTEEVVARTQTSKTVEEIKAKTGIEARNWLEPGQTAAEVCAQALRLALEDAGMEATELRRIIFATSTAGDSFLPPTSCHIMKHLGLAGTCDCFDMNNACMGFLSGLDLAARSVATGYGPVAVVTVECPSWYIKPEDPRPYLVFGDAAGAAILGPSERPDQGVLGVTLGNDPIKGGSLFLPNPGRTGEPSFFEFRASNANMGKIALGAVIDSARALLDRTGLTLEDIDWFVPHQPNGRMLDKMLEQIGLTEDHIVRVVDQIGSTGAASMATGLAQLLRRRPVKSGDLVLLAGVGTGISYGAMLIRV